MRLRQIWKDNKLVGLKLDKGYNNFIEINPRLLKVFINSFNRAIENDKVKAQH